MPSPDTPDAQHLGVLPSWKLAELHGLGVFWRFDWLWVIERNPQLLFLPRDPRVGREGSARSSNLLIRSGMVVSSGCQPPILKLSRAQQESSSA